MNIHVYIHIYIYECASVCVSVYVCGVLRCPGFPCSVLCASGTTLAQAAVGFGSMRGIIGPRTAPSHTYPGPKEGLLKGYAEPIWALFWYGKG